MKHMLLDRMAGAVASNKAACTNCTDCFWSIHGIFFVFCVVYLTGGGSFRCIRTGLPIAGQNAMVSVSMVALQRVTNTFGEMVMAAYTASMRIEQLVQQPFSSLNAAVSTFTGQNIGAEKDERAIKGLRTALRMSAFFPL